MAKHELYYIHKAMLREAKDLERAVAVMDDPAPVAAQAAHLDELLHHHTSAEEEFLFPEIEKRAPRVAETYVYDHKDERALFKEIADALARAKDDPAAREQARRASIVLYTHLDLHIRKENEILVPLLEELFTAEEQAAMIARINSKAPPDAMKTMFPWLMLRLDPEDRVEIISRFKATAPAELVNGMLAVLRAGLPQDVWADLEKRLAE